MPPGTAVVLPAVLLLAAVAACGKSAEFRHAQHITVTKGECAACHGSDAAAPRPAANADCAACHRQAQEASPQGAARYGVEKGRQARAEARGEGRMRFPHAPHAAAGMSCLDCHDASKWRGNTFVRPTAEDCSGCHPGAPGKGAGRPGPPGGTGAGAAANESKITKILI